MLHVIMLHVNLNVLHVITNNLHVNIINQHVDIIYLACRRQKHDSKLNNTVYKTYLQREFQRLVDAGEDNEFKPWGAIV